MSFGVTSAPAIFQKTMDRVLQGIKGIIWYIDDILVTCATEEEHMSNLEKVLNKLQAHGVRMKEKCHFLQSNFQYLEHMIDSEGIHATNIKFKAIVEAPRPKNLQ